jgi:oligosaccharide repeat unit polymerase
MVRLAQTCRSLALSLNARLIFAPAAAIALSITLGFGITTLDLGNALSGPAGTGELALLLSGLAALAALRVRGFVGLGDAGPGAQVATLTLSFAFLAGVLTGAARLYTQETTVAVLFGLAVVAFLAGAVAGARLLGVRRRPISLDVRTDLLRQPLVALIIVGLVAVAVLNLGTGSVPLLSSNIDATRIGGGGGVLGRAWTWIIGGLEWVVIISTIRCFAVRRLDRHAVLVGGVSCSILILLAGRSFLVVAGLGSVVALASLRQFSLTRSAALFLVALAILGVAGKYRLNHSASAEQLGGRGSPYGLISQSAGIGPSVFATALEQVPQFIPFQHGSFILRDLRATLPFHVFGQPESADFWVTRALRGRETAVIGGSPPTLAGGLYIDFGIPGIALGAACLGVLLAAMYRWTLRAQTIGALAAYSYLSAYIALAAYSYISIKPEVVTAIMLSVVLHVLERRSTPHGDRDRKTRSVNIDPSTAP